MKERIAQAKRAAYWAEDTVSRIKEAELIVRRRVLITQPYEDPFAKEEARLRAYKALWLTKAEAAERWAEYWELRKGDPTEEDRRWAAHNAKAYRREAEEARNRAENAR